MLIRGARLVPIRPGEVAPTQPVDVLVRDGVVTQVRPKIHVQDEVVEADGRWLMPGLWDQHVHLGQWTVTQRRLDTSAARDPGELLKIAADAVHATPGKPVIGWGHRPGTWSREATVDDLDAVSGVTPVVLIAGDAHHAWLNSAALAGLGLAPRQDVVRETEWFAAYERLNRLLDDDGTSPDNYRATLEAAAAQGIVGLVDLEFTGSAEDWIERWKQGCDLVRIRMATYAEGLDRVIDARLRTGDPLIPGDDRLTMGPLKIISDGSLNTRTAWCCEPYADAMPGALAPAGAANLPAHELTGLLARAHMSGLEIATHAIGDAAVACALDAYETTAATGSIEHAQLVADADIARLAALGLRASVQPSHLLDDRDLSEQIWPGRTDRCFAFRAFLEAGVDVVLGSDAPVSPLDPWLTVSAAVHRSADDRPAWHPEQALTPQEALAASVDGQPMVAAGSLADLVLLDGDPLAAGSTAEQGAALRAMQVALTMVAGEVTFSR